MRPAALAWIVAATAWFAFGAPRVVEGMRRERIDATRVPTLAELRGYADGQPHRVTREARALFVETRALEAREDAWARTASWLLGPAARVTAAARANEVAPASRDGSRPGVEPEMEALARAIVKRYGAPAATLPEAPATDGWGGYPRAERARAIRGAVERGELDADAAPVLLAATLDAMAAQERRVAIEARLWQILDDGESRRGLGR
jgi:hypothetical protein